MSRRADSKSSKMSALERLKEQRALGKKGIQSYEVNDDDQVYDEVDEADYQMIVRRRLNEEFVVDDDGLGYADQGVDDWNDKDDYSDSEDEQRKPAKRAKDQSNNGAPKPVKRAREQGNIALMMQQQMAKAHQKRVANVVAPGMENSLASGQAAVMDDDGLDDLLNEIDNETKQIVQTVKASSTHQRKKKKTNLSITKPTLAVSNAVQDFNHSLKSTPIDEDCGPIDEMTAIDPDFDPSDTIDPSLENTEESIMLPKEEESRPEIKAVSQEHSALKHMEPIISAAPVKVLQKKVPFKQGKSSTISAAVRPTPLVANQSQTALRPSQQPPGSNGNDWWAAQKNINSASQPLPNLSQAPVAPQSIQEIHQSIYQDSGSLLMFWLDSFEQNGLVYIFGKVWNSAANSFVSACLTVRGIERSIFVLPRVRKLSESGQETDIEVDMQLLWEELDGMLTSKYKIRQWALQETKKKYAFEVPDIPVEADWVEVNYGYSMPTLPKNLSGKTFSHVFGTNTNAMEQFLLKTDLMGPCWIEIKESKPINMNATWCRLEIDVDFTTQIPERIADGDGFNIRPIRDSDLDSGKYPSYCRSAPPLVVMSLNLKSVMNYKTNINEIVIASALIYHKVQTDSATPDEDQKLVSSYTFVRPLSDRLMPMEFASTVSQRNLKIECLANERALLNFLMALIHRTDPDVLVGHNFLGFFLDVLLHRMRDLRVDHWSRIGRLRRSQFPKLQSGAGGMGETTFGEKSVVSGRLICDSYLAAKDLIKAKSYSLSQLSDQVLSVKRVEVDFEKIPQFYDRFEDLIWLCQHNENDAFLSMRLILQLMVLPLTKQLTNLAGNLWSRTLTGGRAERNEYLLLHEFFKQGYILPDKSFGSDSSGSDKLTGSAANNAKGKKASAAKKKAATNIENLPVNISPEADDDNEEVEMVAKKGGRRKPAYAGGLVLEPKKGLYDKYVLMLDFNSLYPSIIQEYNICFTTVERHLATDGEDEEIPELPDSSLEQGTLPRLLATLVQRRRQVKGLMKGLDAKSAEYSQLNIRQQALKLTANSMYGCLGFTHSRFYAKPLAMLITSKGREILQDTVNLAESLLNLEVIYGDTDSIMIYTASDNLAEVKKIGQNLKTAVNKKYKLLEIEMDGFFRRMLLLKKKKYAALVATEGESSLTLTRETKGLDLVRRDWCGLSKDICNYVLDQILSDADREQVLENIHNYLRQMGTEIRDGNIPIDKYVIDKSLTKSPEDYHDAKVQPHVQVALRMKGKGLSARAGDTIPYVICADEDPLKSYALRAYHPDDLKKEDCGLCIDFEYYLNNQIHPPVARLCRPIDGTDDGMIASCLGLDPSKFRSVSTGDKQEDEVATLGSQISDRDRFRDVDKLKFGCVTCEKDFELEEMIRKEGNDLLYGHACPKCNNILSAAQLINRFVWDVRKCIEKYYAGWIVCEESSCQYRTRAVSVYATTCPVDHCKGTMNMEYSASQLYTQLQYYLSLFDADRYLKRIKSAQEKSEYELVLRAHQETLQIVLAYIRRYSSINARGFVNIKELFGFLDQSFTANSQLIASR